MRIVHLILTRQFAGSERHAIELANAQAARHEVTLVLRRAAAGEHPGAYADRVDPRVRLHLVGDWFARWHARRLVRRLRPEVAHAHLSAACKALHGLRGLCLRVATLHICYKPAQHADLDALVAIAPWQLAAIPPALRARTVQLDNWTLPRVPAPGAREQLRAQLGIAPDAWVFGAVGRIEPSKGFDRLLEAFAGADLPGVHLVVLGQGPALDRLRLAGVPRAHFPGFADRPEDWLAAFDTFVSAARDEPFGLVLLEAMQAGLPIIATATQGARHLADVIGRPLVPLDSAEALGEALRTAADERPPRRVYPMARFHIEDKLDALDAFYRAQATALSAA